MEINGAFEAEYFTTKCTVLKFIFYLNYFCPLYSNTLIIKKRLIKLLPLVNLLSHLTKEY